VSENRVLRRIFGPVAEKVTGGYRKPIVLFPNIIWMPESRRTR
jgi:hypothetical protein